MVCMYIGLLGGFLFVVVALLGVLWQRRLPRLFGLSVDEHCRACVLDLHDRMPHASTADR